MRFGDNYHRWAMLFCSVCAMALSTASSSSRALSSSADTTTFVLTGTDSLSSRGGCEDSDDDCKAACRAGGQHCSAADAFGEKTLQFIEARPGGSLVRRVDLAWQLTGTPMWATSEDLPSGAVCIFAALGESSLLVSARLYKELPWAVESRVR